MSEKIPKAICSGELEIGEIIIPCHVLEGGTRVLVQRKMVEAMGMSRGGSSKGGGDRLAHFVNGKALSPFINNELAAVTKSPSKFKTERGNTAYCYEATVLADLCDAVFEANKQGKLQMQQKHIAERCEILMRGFARIGIIALVDEATGYQEIRDRDELQKILKAYISDELMPWTERFPMEFFKEMFRLWKWPFNPIDYKKKGPRGPRYAGKLVKKLIYEELPPGVLQELEKKNPQNDKWQRKKKLFQWLSEDIGNRHLEKQVAVVTALFKISPNKKIFERNFNRAFQKMPQQEDLFPELEEPVIDI